MPSAVPYQEGLIGEYNNSSTPGVYVSWDANTNFNSVYSLIFRGYANINYRFPLIVNSYNGNNLGTPKSIDRGSQFIYVLNSSNVLIVFKLLGDSYSYVYSTSLIADKISVANVAGLDYIFSSYASTKNVNVHSFDGSSFNSIGTVNSFNSYSWTTYDFIASPAFMYFATDNNIYILPYTINSSSITPGSVSNIAPQSFSTTAKKIAIFGFNKIAVLDTNNTIFEWINNGPVGVGNTSGFQWDLNFTLNPTTQNYQALIYNHTGLLIACDGANNQVVLIGGQNVTTQTQNYGTFDGFTYQKVSKTSSTTYQGSILNILGSEGTSYQQFNNPVCIVEDQSWNLMVGDDNNRLTYIPTQLDYLGLVPAPLSEYIDNIGNPATVYYIKQATQDFTSILSLAPLTGDELLIKSSVLYELNSLLRVPIYDEEPIYGYLRQSASLAYGDIVTDPAPQVRITCPSAGGQTDSMFVLSPYVGFSNSLGQDESDPFYNQPNTPPNYPNGLYYRFTNEGKIYFFDAYGNAISLQEYDIILVTYYVKLFTNAQINNALYLALQAINAQPGLNKIKDVRSTPFFYDQTLVSGATYYLLRQLAVGLNSRERRLLVQDAEQGSFDVVANVKDVAKMYQEEFNELLKKLPINQRPVMGTITVPTYALPGGRSRLFRQIWSGSQGH